MKQLRFLFSILIANFAVFLLRVLKGSSATAFPGLVSLKISPDFFSIAQLYCKKNIINITGTNGKTTTAGIFAHILKQNKNSVIHNEKGANMLSGIASALAIGLKMLQRFDYFVLEADEAYLTRLYDSMNADCLIVTNLFRDQLDRYGELDTTFKKLQDAISKNKQLKLFLNADDPMVSNLGKSNKKIYYGFDEITYAEQTEQSSSPQECVFCKCGKTFSYSQNFYAHIGHYSCECGKSRPTPDYSATAKIYSYKSQITVRHKMINYDFTVYQVGVYNAYNALAAIVMALEFGINQNIIQKALNTYEPAFGRAERTKIKNKNTLIQLIKNPVGATEVLRTVQNSPKTRLMIAINDNYADGRDVSWLWDADFSLLENFKEEIVVSGERAYDIALRLQYAGVDVNNIKVINKINKAVSYSADKTPKDGLLVILPTYTALLNMQKFIKDLV